MTSTLSRTSFDSASRHDAEHSSALMEEDLFELRRLIVGQDHLLECLLVALLARGHVLLEGVPGLAKTATVKALARVAGGSFGRIQFTPDLVPADLVGTRIYTGSGAFSTELGPVFANLVLADEISSHPAGAQVGVVSFSDTASVSAPLSADPNVAQQALDRLSAGGGTAIGDGLTLALDQLAQRPSDAHGNRPPAVVVLLSDGESNAGRSPAAAAARAQQEGVTVNTIGIGTRGVQTSLNRRTSVGLDESTLKSIASTTSGEYFYAADAGQLEQIYAHLGSQISWVREQTEVTAIASGLCATFLTVAGVLSPGWFGASREAKIARVLDHLSIQCADVSASAAFYDAVLAPLGGGRVMDFGNVVGYGLPGRPTFWVGPLTTGEPNREVHIAFQAPDRAAVRAFFATAVAKGATVLHEPRVWPEYHPGYYGGFVRDPDGNNVEAVCHRPE